METSSEVTDEIITTVTRNDEDDIDIRVSLKGRLDGWYIWRNKRGLNTDWHIGNRANKNFDGKCKPGTTIELIHAAADMLREHYRKVDAHARFKYQGS